MSQTPEQFSGDASQFIGGAYYKREDFENMDEDLLVTIAGVEKTTFTPKDGPPEERLQLAFREADTKKLTLNATNLKIIFKGYGQHTSGWIGKPVLIYLDENVSFGGRLVGGLRLRIPKVRPKPRPALQGTFLADTDAPWDVESNPQ